VKQYNRPAEGYARYSPPEVVGVEREAVCGTPEPRHISTSYIERQNLTVRMSNRRFTRLTNAFSKSLQNHKHAVALHYFHYNFCRVHQTIKTTPAVAAGIANKVWTMVDFVELLEREERLLKGRLTDYKPAASKKR
jgi:hypothetical protein